MKLAAWGYSGSALTLTIETDDEARALDILNKLALHCDGKQFERGVAQPAEYVPGEATADAAATAEDVVISGVRQAAAEMNVTLDEAKEATAEHNVSPELSDWIDEQINDHAVGHDYPATELPKKEEPATPEFFEGIEQSDDTYEADERAAIQAESNEALSGDLPELVAGSALLRDVVRHVVDVEKITEPTALRARLLGLEDKVTSLRGLPNAEQRIQMTLMAMGL